MRIQISIRKKAEQLKYYITFSLVLGIGVCHFILRSALHVDLVASAQRFLAISHCWVRLYTNGLLGARVDCSI